MLAFLAVCGSADGAADRLDESAVITDRALTSPVMKLARSGSRVVAVGARGHILYSDDDGDSWLQAQSPVRTTLTTVAFVDSEVGWAAGHDTVVLRSLDGGLSWQSVLDGRDANRLRHLHLEALVARLEQELRSAEDRESRSSLQRRLVNAEALLDEVERDLEIGPHKPLLSVAFLDRDRGIAVGANGLLLGTDDGGETWQDWSDRLDNDLLLHLYGASTVGQAGFLVVGESGKVHRSEDGGRTWTRTNSPTEVSLFGVLESPGPGTVFAFGMAGQVYEHSILNNEWAAIGTPRSSILQGGNVDSHGRLYIAGMERTLLRQADVDSALEPISIPAFSINSDVLPRLDASGVIVAGDGGIRVFSISGVSDEQAH